MHATPSPDAIQSDAPRSRPFFTMFLVMVCVALAAEVSLLVRSNRNLRRQLAESSAALQGNTLNIHPGKPFDLPPLVNEAGDEFRVEFGSDQPRTLVLVYSSSCRACVETIPIWNAMLPAAGSEAIRVVPILLGSEESLPVTASPIATSSYRVADGEDAFMRRVLKVPTTILLDRNGVVDQAWMGFLTKEKESDLLEAIATNG